MVVGDRDGIGGHFIVDRNYACQQGRTDIRIIDSTGLYSNNASGANYTNASTSASGNIDISFTWEILSLTSGGQFTGIQILASPGNGYAFGSLFSTGTSEWYMQKLVSGSGTNLTNTNSFTATTTPTGTPTYSMLFTVRTSGSSTTLSVYVNDTLVVTNTDSSSAFQGPWTYLWYDSLQATSTTGSRLNNLVIMDAGVMVAPDTNTVLSPATRDSGYKGTVSAISELVDNSLQAGAKNVWISVAATGDEKFPINISILDDGGGMDKRTLRQSLRFGGSSRFDDRSGLGRFGMGLPNSSLSQARRVEVFSWRKSTPLFTYLDVDEIAAGEMKAVPEPETKPLPQLPVDTRPITGTLVLWQHCDRLSHSRISTIVKKLGKGLGQTFRHFIWNGITISINRTTVDEVDPLFLRDKTAPKGTVVFGEPMPYPITAPSSGSGDPKVGIVTVLFTELPVHELHMLSNEEKRDRGISNGAGVSVVRGSREVDFGWFFMGSKRRENYDDWWRCEVSFDPVLDEAFGITHTKQQIRPQEFLNEILVPDIESMAKTLNTRVRHTHTRLKAGDATREVEETVGNREKLLEPLPKISPTPMESPAVKALLKQYPALKEPSAGSESLDFRIVEANVKETTFFSYTIVNGYFVLNINPEHPFSRRVYRPLSELETPEAKRAKHQIELLLMAAVRAEAAGSKAGDRRTICENRQRWSDILATYLNR